MEPEGGRPWAAQADTNDDPTPVISQRARDGSRHKEFVAGGGVAMKPRTRFTHSLTLFVYLPLAPWRMLLYMR